MYPDHGYANVRTFVESMREAIEAQAKSDVGAQPPPKASGERIY